MTTLDLSLSGIAERYAEIGAQLAARHDVQNTFEAVTELAVHTVPGAEHAGITRSWSDHFDTVAPTDPLVGSVDRIQYDLASGPCISAVCDGEVFHTGDLAADSRWPEFGRRAHAETGVRSMLAYRLWLDGDREPTAGLNLYSRAPEAFDENAVAIGMLLATHGALAVRGAAATERADNLSVALATNRRIGVAIGVLMSAQKVTEEQAFDLLRIASQTVNRKLRDIAEDVALTGVLPLPVPPAAAPG